MRIKKYQGNEYICTSDGVWVRNFNQKGINPLNINSTDESLQKDIIFNELSNMKKKYKRIDESKVQHDHVVILSDGYNFEEKYKMLSKLPSVAVIGINGTLKKWNLHTLPDGEKKWMYYLTNNPFKECMNFASQDNSYRPACVASTRTFSRFLEEYPQDNVYLYVPTPEENFNTNIFNSFDYTLDDYKNPICAAINLAHKFQAKKLLLMCCDDSFEKERPGSIPTGKGTWMYPQHKIAHNIIDLCLHWYKKSLFKTSVKESSSGLHYANAEYITEEEEIINFFKDEETQGLR